MIEKIITDSFAVSSSASLNAPQRMPRQTAIRNTTNAPIAPPSVGVPQASPPKGL